jgi:hypothetical protein
MTGNQRLDIGIVCGLFAAVAVAKNLASQLHGVAPFNVATIVGACAVMAAIGLLAILWPARRATQQDPMRAERELSEKKERQCLTRTGNQSVCS